MNASAKPVLKAVSDGHSYQVYAPYDEHFWFRLVREADHDLITDYFIGSFPKEQAHTLLRECYALLGLAPKQTIIFSDILSGRAPQDSRILEAARQFYAACGRTLLLESGARLIEEHLENAFGKWHLTVVAQRDGANMV